MLMRGEPPGAIQNGQKLPSCTDRLKDAQAQRPKTYILRWRRRETALVTLPRARDGVLEQFSYEPMGVQAQFLYIQPRKKPLGQLR